MFKAVIKAETLKSIVYVVSTIVDEVKVTVTTSQMRIKAIDPAHVAMLDISIGKQAFISYEAEDVELGLDLDKIKAILKLADGSDEIILEHDPEQGRLTMRINNITRRTSLVDTAAMNDPRVPQLDIPNHVVISSEVLKMGIKASEAVSDHITVSLSNDGFKLSCEGDTDSAALEIASSDTKDLTVDGNVKCMYPLDYFSNIIKVIPDKTDVDVHLGTEFPIQLLFSLADGGIKVVYFLAPRIEND